MTREEVKSCIGTIEMLQRLAYNIHGVMDVIDADNCKKIIKALEQEPEPVYFPPCVDCQNRSKEILTAYNNMINKKTFTKEEVITMLDKIRAEIEQITDTINVCYYQYVNKIDVLQIIDKYKAESEEKE